MDPDGPLPMATPDDDLAAAIDASEYVEPEGRRPARARARRSTVDGPFFALSNNVGNEVLGHRVRSGSPRARPARPARTGWRRICSPDSDRRVPPRRWLPSPSIFAWHARPDATTGPAPEREGGRVVLALILGLALLASGAYVGAYVATSDKVPVGTRSPASTSAARTSSSAVHALRAGSRRAHTSVHGGVNGRTQQVPPSDVGLRSTTTPRSARPEPPLRRPSRLWGYFTDGSAFDPVVTLDQDRLAALIERLDATDGRTATDGSVMFRDRTFTVQPPRPGLALDPRVAGTAFWNAYLSGNPSVHLRMMPTAPAIDAAVIQRFVRRFANPAMASSVESCASVARPCTCRRAPTASSWSPDASATRSGQQVRAQALARLTDSRWPALRSTGRPRPPSRCSAAGRTS